MFFPLSVAALAVCAAGAAIYFLSAGALPSEDGDVSVFDSGPAALSEEGEEKKGQEDEGRDDETENDIEWERPRIDERSEERLSMVEDQIERRGVECGAVLDAMRHVPRHMFVKGEYERQAYADRPLPIPDGQTISQPYIVGHMTELLSVEAGDRVLEIGTGSGYQAAVLAELTPYVFSIEIIEDLLEWGKNNLEEVGYDTVKVKAEDGYFGWEEHAPFDKVIVTAAAGHVPTPLREQLAPGGKMVIPVGSPYETQYLVLLDKDEEGEVSSEHLMPVRFVPLTGQAQEGAE